MQRVCKCWVKLHIGEVKLREDPEAPVLANWYRALALGFRVWFPPGLPVLRTYALVHDVRHCGSKRPPTASVAVIVHCSELFIVWSKIHQCCQSGGKLHRNIIIYHSGGMRDPFQAPSITHPESPVMHCSCLYSCIVYTPWTCLCYPAF